MKYPWWAQLIVWAITAICLLLILVFCLVDSRWNWSLNFMKSLAKVKKTASEQIKQSDTGLATKGIITEIDVSKLLVVECFYDVSFKHTFLNIWPATFETWYLKLCMLHYLYNFFSVWRLPRIRKRGFGCICNEPSTSGTHVQDRGSRLMEIRQGSSLPLIGGLYT